MAVAPAERRTSLEAWEAAARHAALGGARSPCHVALDSKWWRRAEALLALQRVCALAHECARHGAAASHAGTADSGSTAGSAAGSAAGLVAGSVAGSCADVGAAADASAGDCEGLEGGAGVEGGAAALNAALAALGERCALLLAHAHALSRLEMASAATGGEAAAALPAADWLLSAYRAEEDADAPAPARAHAEHLRQSAAALYEAARDVQGTAAARPQLLGQRGGLPPAREACLLCERPVPVEAGRMMQRCAGGHALVRCWVCFKLLPLRAWTCGTCGAGSCAEHAGVSGGILCAISPKGVCGLCGSPCAPPQRTLFC